VPAEKDNQSIMDNLLRQGTAPEEIQKVYRSLREKGYGEEEARRRTRRAAEKLAAQKKALDVRRKSGTAAAARAPDSTAAETAPRARPAQAASWVPPLPIHLRRRIDRYAFRNGYLITRFPEIFDDFLMNFDPRRGDYINRGLLRLLAEEKGYRGVGPYRLSLVDALAALRESAARLLGGGFQAYAARDASTPPSAGEAIRRELRNREPFAEAFFSVFLQPNEALSKDLERLGTALRAHRRVRVGELARIVKDGCRLILIADPIERDKLDTLFDVLREVNATHRPGSRASAEFAESEALFRASFQSLHHYAHELYPALLKMMLAFYEEANTSSTKRAAIHEFLGIRPHDILTWEGWQERARMAREKEMREKQARELARLEQEKAEKFSVRFEGTIATLASLFPGSGVERMEQGAPLLPYFANRVFVRTSLYQARSADMERLSSADFMSLVLVIHSILDDMLSSLAPNVLEKIVGRDGWGKDMVEVRDLWREAFPKVFEPYMDAIREYARETEGDARYTNLFRESPQARNIGDRVHQLRALVLRGYAKSSDTRGHAEGPLLYDLAARLAALLTEAGQIVNQGTAAAADPVNKKIMADLREHGMVDFVASAQLGTVDYHPVTRQIRRWIEARFRESVTDIAEKAQVGFLDILRGVAYLYDALLNDGRSPARRDPAIVTVSSAEDRDAWAKEREARGRDSEVSLQATLREQFPGQFVDALTGLKNKDYFLTQLPHALERLRARHRPFAFIMIDIDHFKWVNDSLGHPRGDEILKSTASLILDNIRESDVAIRYGGEEILVVASSDLHTGIILAERLRYAQENRVLTRDAMKDVRAVSVKGGEPCGTLSIGVGDVTSVTDLMKAVGLVDKALYAAKKGRNAVVVTERKGAAGADTLTTYAEYRKRTGSKTA
jgi:diguanylate cyclase (GGDEF)-like protein